MSKNPLALKVAAPYARALFDFVKDTGTMFQVTSDLNRIQRLFFNSTELVECLQNPLISGEAKQEILIKVVGEKMNIETIQFISILIRRNRINLLPTILKTYLELVFETSGSRSFQIYSATRLSNGHRIRLINKIRALGKSKRIKIHFKIDESLIGGFLIINKGKVLDYTVKNKLKTLAKQLDTVLKL